MKRRILIVDDHPITAIGMEMYLKTLLHNCEFVTVYTSDDAIEHLKHTSFDLLVTDLMMPDTDSHNYIHQILAINKGQRILVVTMQPEIHFAKRYYQMGCMGFLNKEVCKDEVAVAIEKVMNGEKYYSRKFRDSLMEDLIEGNKPNLFDKLSKREFEIMTHLLQGLSNTEICNITQLHSSTIGTHKQKIFEKLKVGNVLELIEIAKNNGMLKHKN